MDRINAKTEVINANAFEKYPNPLGKNSMIKPLISGIKTITDNGFSKMLFNLQILHLQAG
jgi:hypothetical protein